MTQTIPEIDPKLESEITPNCIAFRKSFPHSRGCNKKAVWIVYLECPLCGYGYVEVCDKHCRLIRVDDFSCGECLANKFEYKSRERL